MALGEDSLKYQTAKTKSCTYVSVSLSVARAVVVVCKSVSESIQMKSV
jgi:hypothetical protein